MNVKYLLSRGAVLFACACVLLGCAKNSATGNQAATAATVPLNPAEVMPSPTQNPEDKMARVKVEEAKQQVTQGKAVIIDVRGTDAYKLAHIKGALDIPLNKLESSDFSGLPKDKRIIAYCT
jgi:3-mercaptopyruvate sulfurtransferase SseA